ETQAAGSGASGGPTFITPASLVTFAGATFAIKIVLQVIKKLWDLKLTEHELLWITFGVSVAVGVVVVYLTLTVPGARPTTRPQWVGALTVAALNTLYLFLAAADIAVLPVTSAPRAPTQ